MKRFAVILLIVGLVLGVAQFFVVYEKTFVSKQKINRDGICDAVSPECGTCLYEADGEYCIQRDTKPVVGFPFFAAGLGVDWRTNQQVDYRHFVNLALLLLPGISFFAFVRLKK